jgi:Lrp/AsnC family leucine-responsive transcriptional regulator
MNLDETDVNILKVLQVNGRLSFRQIAERVKVSVPTVSNKISNMENLGIIRGYIAEFSPEKLGELSVIMNIKAKPSELRSIAQRFERDEHVRTMCTISNGRLLMICTFSEPHLINEFVSRLVDIPEIMEYDISNIISVVKESQRAIIAPGLTVLLQCAYCRKDIRDEGVKVKVEGKDYYLCCHTCRQAFEEKYEKLKARA